MFGKLIYDAIAVLEQVFAPGDAFPAGEENAVHGVQVQFPGELNLYPEKFDHFLNAQVHQRLKGRKIGGKVLAHVQDRLFVESQVKHGDSIGHPQFKSGQEAFPVVHGRNLS
jgi:hypothetical protein